MLGKKLVAKRELEARRSRLAIKSAQQRLRYKRIGSRKSNAKSKKFLPISSFWSPKAQAYAFWFLVRIQKKCTFTQAKRDILMTMRQLTFLLESATAIERVILDAIYTKRQQTWTEFLYLCCHPEAAAEYRAADNRMGGEGKYNG